MDRLSSEGRGGNCSEDRGDNCGEDSKARLGRLNFDHLSNKS